MTMLKSNLLWQFNLFKQICIWMMLRIMQPVIAGWMYLSDEVEYARFHDPSDRYEAVVTYPRYLRLLAGWLGERDRRLGTVRIYDIDGQYYGAQAVDVIGLARDRQWVPDVAPLQAIGAEWLGVEVVVSAEWVC
ncbi:hypothetical protein IQ266_12855 [filamentous cyanobacterium LEGE 11480]|uniref:Uncharacterized protein n=1 Tax=Romeriopsis navalis LEGE 11480 TaxID=2777977 RepID=A0A928VL82_9CYAN|nr:hypothetical protein [Romeriopsis navalis]MBE9030621.1 hypothetical protein [Romeriopsis navalis LEGE 11480]